MQISFVTIIITVRHCDW